jgi:hypothetical protein
LTRTMMDKVWFKWICSAECFVLVAILFELQRMDILISSYHVSIREVTR